MTSVLGLATGLAFIVAFLTLASTAPAAEGQSCSCQNGGNCQPDNSCKCSPDHVGVHCEKYCDHETEDAECVCHGCDYGGISLENPATGYISHRRFCNIFFQCVRSWKNGKLKYVKYRMACPTGLHFSSETKTCVWPRDSTCKTGIIDDGATPRPQTTYPPDLSCFDNGKEFQRHPENCFTYQHCVHGKAVDMCCPANLTFDENTLRCEHPLDYDHCGCEIVPCQAGPKVPVHCEAAIACYPFRENTLQDMSINRAHTTQPSASRVQLIKRGKSWFAKFDGKNDLLQNHYFSGAFTWNEPEQFTIYAEFKAAASGAAEQGIVSNGDCHYAATFGMRLVKVNNDNKYVECFFNDREDGAIRSSVVIRSDKKYGVTCLYDAGRGTLNIHVGYMRCNRDKVFLGPVKSSLSPMFIGFDGCLKKNKLKLFKGRLYQVRIFREIYTKHITYTGP